MSFFQPNILTSLTSSKFDEQQWIKHIRQTLDEELEEETEIPVTIFTVPKTLMLSNPNCYIPHQVAIGPYHHLRAELYDMERYKVAAAKRNQKELQNMKFQDIVDHVMKHELRIRASYHRPLDYSGEALAWMVAVDASFLFEFFQVCGVKEVCKVLTKVPSRLEHLIGLSRNKTANNAILRDIMMLENQIPLFVMRMMLEFQHPSLEMADEMLSNMLMGLCEELSPFKMVEGTDKIEVNNCAHLLDFLYKFIAPKIDVSSQIIEIHEEADDGEEKEMKEEDSTEPPSHLRHLLDQLWEILSPIKDGPIKLFKKIIFSKPLTLIVKLPWTIISKIPIFSMLKGPIENMFSAFQESNKEKKEDDETSSDQNNKPPLQEEIAIPSVSQLLQAGVQFLPINEGITSISFDEHNLIFHIPVIDLDVNSEVVLRNLVAYEACSINGPLVLARYMELMNGIIDTDVDAKLLCERAIIVNHLKSEKEVAELWNGMSKSIRLTKVPSLDKVIGDVNRFYNGRWKVKFEKFMKERVFGSWRILTFLAAVALLLLMCLQAFCQVYSCSRILPIKALEPATKE